MDETSPLDALRRKRDQLLEEAKLLQVEASQVAQDMEKIARLQRLAGVYGIGVVIAPDDNRERANEPT